MTRAQTHCAAALVVTVALGLASRRWPLPGVLAEYTGDALYATSATFAFAVLRPAWRTRTLALAAFAVSAAIEFSQLLHPPWLDDLRTTLPGRLLLGQGYQTADLFAYAVGALLGAAVDRALIACTRCAPADRAPPQAPT